jgi:hypothetical protein
LQETKEAQAANSERAIETPSATPDDGPVLISVENYRPDDAVTFYSDGMVVVHTENEFVLSFLQTEFPLARTTEELKEVRSMRRKCIAQIIVSPPQAEAIISVLQENFAKYVSTYRKSSSDR